MSEETNSKNQGGNDARPDAIGQVWGTAVGMLAICIPLCVLLKSGALPIIVICAAVLVSMYVWKTEPRKTTATNKEAEELRAQIRELEERLANVEVINHFEERLAERTIAREEEQAAARELESTA